MAAATTFIHCVPPVTADESFSSPTGLHSAPGLNGYNVQRGCSRQHSKLPIVELSLDDCKPNLNNKQKRLESCSSNSMDGRLSQQRGFPMSNTSRVHRLRLDRMSAVSSNKAECRPFPDQAKKEYTSQGKGRNSRGSAGTSIERVYKPTLPKYCFSASRYQSVLTDYSTSAELGVVRPDIAQLPPPRHTLMTRELPFVYRYKIQQGISSLNNMIPTKRTNSQPTDHIW